MISRKSKTALIILLSGICVLVIAAFLTLAINQARILISLYAASVASASGLSAKDFMRSSPRSGNDLVILVSVAAVLFLLVVRRPRRLLPLSINAVLVFAGLNLYSGRHLLPQLLIWPTPVSLSEQYVQALAANDLDKILRLTDQSPTCKRIMAQVFEDHRARLEERVGDDRPEADIRDVSVMRLLTFYDKPVPEGFVIMQPAPQQLAFIAVELENNGTVWLNLKMSYQPFLGVRYLCGQDIDSSMESIVGQNHPQQCSAQG